MGEAMTYQIRAANPSPRPFTRRRRTLPISQIQIHATRGPVMMDQQVQATENWFAAQPDRGGWGASADFVVGPDRRKGGKIVIVQFGDWLNTYSSWSAGYGSIGPRQEYGAAEVGVAIEIAQPDNNTPFTPETIDAVAWLCRWINKTLEQQNRPTIPAVAFGNWNQLRTGIVPRGYIGHDALANGRKLGKTDPGRMWDWNAFLELVKDEPAGKPKPLSYVDHLMALVRGKTTTAPAEMRGDTSVYELHVRR